MVFEMCLSPRGDFFQNGSLALGIFLPLRERRVMGYSQRPGRRCRDCGRRTKSLMLMKLDGRVVERTSQMVVIGLDIQSAPGGPAELPLASVGFGVWRLHTGGHPFFWSLSILQPPEPDNTIFCG